MSSGPETTALLQEHLRDMYRVSPPESVHALDLESLRTPDITVWTLWEAGVLAGCGALKELDPQHAEIKSMRTARRTGARAWRNGSSSISWRKPNSVATRG
jgi:putative acetyltransferase